jgi:hypothetical protein
VKPEWPRSAERPEPGQQPDDPGEQDAPALVELFVVAVVEAVELLGVAAWSDAGGRDEQSVGCD